jgi:hypothetical protein
VNKSDFSYDRPPGLLISLIVPLAAPICLFFIEAYLVPLVFLMPLVLVLVLCYLAMRLSPRAVMFWMLFYIALVIVAAQISVEPEPVMAALRPYVRSGFVFAGGITAFLLASHRARMGKSNQALFKVISALPSPVVVSDISGNILLMNKQCQDLLARQHDPLSAVSFFSTFVSREDQGLEIQKYLKYFDAEDGDIFPAVLQTRGEPPLVLEVVITIVTLGNIRYAVMAIEKAGGVPPRNTGRVFLQAPG